MRQIQQVMLKYSKLESRFKVNILDGYKLGGGDFASASQNFKAD